MAVFEISYINQCDLTFAQWTIYVTSIISSLTTNGEHFQLGIIWLPHTQLSVHQILTFTTALTAGISEPWAFSNHCMNSTLYGDAIDSNRDLYVVTTLLNDSNFEVPPSHSDSSLFQSFLQQPPFPNSPTTTFTLRQSQLCPQSQDQKSGPMIVAELTPSDTTSAIIANNCILDTSSQGLEPTVASFSNSILGRRFGILLHRHDNHVIARSITNIELLLCYSLPMTCLSTDLNNISYSDFLDDCLPFAIPAKLRSSALSHLVLTTGLASHYMYATEEIVNSSYCYSTQIRQDVLDWTQSYKDDADTHRIIVTLSKNMNHKWSQKELQEINEAYRPYLLCNHVGVLHLKLVVFSEIFKNKKYQVLIVVPRPLRRKFFDHYHAGPCGGHMGIYKTTFRIKQRFFWPKLRDTIRTWVKQCAHCVAYDLWPTRQSELHFSWPVTSPFYIMHADLWSPGDTTMPNGKSACLLNTLCDLTQFVVCMDVTACQTSSHLAIVFTREVIMTFGMVAVLVVDADSKFLKDFEIMCQILRIHLWPLSRGNHKGNSVERFHRFLNKTQTIRGNDRGTHQIFFENAKTTQFAWNSAHIDNTDITRSMAAIGREFKFPLDIECSALPVLNDSANSALFSYLRSVSTDSVFATGILQILVHERRQYHRDRHNSTLIKSSFEVGDVVKVHVQVTSNAATNTVGKLAYAARGPFIIKEV